MFVLKFRIKNEFIKKFIKKALSISVCHGK